MYPPRVLEDSKFNGLVETKSRHDGIDVLFAEAH